MPKRARRPITQAICLGLAAVTLAATARAEQPAAPPVPAPYPPQPYPSQGYPPQPYPPPAPTYAPPAATAYVPMVPGPRYIRYEDGQPVPPGYQLEQRMWGGMVIPGGVLFGVFYSIGALIAAGSNPPRDAGWLVAPVIGPWVMLASTTDGAGRFFLTSDGIVQAASVALLVVGFHGRKVLVRSDLASLTVTPVLMGSAGHGAMLTARF